MYCCKECFSDPYIINKIELETTLSGQCDYCGCDDVILLDILLLQEDFHKLAQYYSSTEPYEHFHPAIHSDPSGYGDLLINLINEDWGIFSEEISGTGSDERLLFDIVNFGARDPIDVYEEHGLYSRISDAFTFVHPLEDWDELWDKFKQVIKHQSRFFPMEQSDQFFEYMDLVIEAKTTELVKGELVYRSRNGRVKNDKMLAPPNEISTPGRANPKGISYLYAASDDRTSVAEIRPWKGAVVTVAQLKVSKNLSVVDFSSMKLSPFSFGSPIAALIVEKMLTAFTYELSQPVDPNNSELDYLSTQFITELIKSKKYDGIIFKSSLGSGKNLVIFDERYLNVINTSYKTVTDIQYTTESNDF